MVNRKTVSPVIGTVLLIMLTIMAIAIIASIIIPMIRENLESGASCFELRDHLKVVSSREYSCYNGSETRVEIKRGLENVSIDGIYVSLKKGGTQKPFKITQNPNLSNVKMINSTGNRTDDLEMLGPGEAKTYVFTEIGNSDKVSIAVIQNGNTCRAQSYTLPKCSL